MKRRKIGYFGDSTINYRNMLALYEIVDLNKEIALIDLIICDVASIEESKHELIKLRAKMPKVPVLWVVDPLEVVDALTYLNYFEGLGRVQIEFRNHDDPEGIVQTVAMLLHPDLPTKRVTMDLFVPVFNEAHRMQFVKAFVKKLQQMHDMGYPYITIYFIDDGSNDNSELFLSDMIQAYYDDADSVEFKAAFRLLKLPENTRKAGTYMEAFRVSTADIVIFADADDAFDLKDITKLINIMHQGFYDIVIGTKDKTAENRPIIREVISMIKRMLTKPLLPKGITDSQTGLKVFRGPVVKPILVQLDKKYGLAIDLKIIHLAKKMNLRVVEVPVHFTDCEGSHIDVIKDSFRFVKNIIRISIGM